MRAKPCVISVDERRGQAIIAQDRNCGCEFYSPALAPAQAMPESLKVKTMPKSPQKNQTKTSPSSSSDPLSKPTSAPEAGAARKPSSGAAKREHNTTFVLVAPDAKQVAVCGEFNAWSPNATPMQRRKDGRWWAEIALQPGRYQYKFVADGQWLHDPARDTVPNEHGSLNSVVVVAP